MQPFHHENFERHVHAHQTHQPDFSQLMQGGGDASGLDDDSWVSAFFEGLISLFS